MDSKKGFAVVVLCEKPKQASAFKAAYSLNETHTVGGKPVAYYDRLGGVCVVFMSGHLLELMPPEFYQPKLKTAGWSVELLPVIPSGSRWKIAPIKNKENLISGLKWSMVTAGVPGEIAIAVDNDREGDLLAWETLEYLGVDRIGNISRMCFSEVSPEAMRKAFQSRTNARDQYERFLSGRARQYSDWLFGMNFTIGLTADNKKFIPRDMSLNSGRVVYAITYLMYMREREVLDYKPLPYYTEKVTFVTARGEQYVGRVVTPEVLLDQKHKKVMQQAAAEKVHRHILEKKDTATVVSYTQENVSKKPPIGFDRASLNSHLIRKLGVALEDIANILQTLYDNGYITYPRVDSKYLDADMRQTMPSYLASMARNINSKYLTDAEKALYGKALSIASVERKSNIWKTGVSTSESHHAIITTAQNVDVNKLSDIEFKVYREILDRLLIQFLPDYEYAKTKIVTKVGSLLCNTTGSVPLKKGWRGLTEDTAEKPETTDEDGETSAQLPQLTIGERVSVGESVTETAVLVKPKRYSIPELIEDLVSPGKYVKNPNLNVKKLEIGTSATRDQHIASLAKKSLVVERKREGSRNIVELHPTKKMIKTVEIAPTYFKYPEVCALWENEFDKIEKKETTFDGFMAQQLNVLNRFMKELREGKFRLTEPVVERHQKCSVEGCDGHLFYLEIKRKSGKGSFGAWCCSSCNVGYFDKNGAPGELMGGERTVVDTKTGKSLTCPVCKEYDAYHMTVPGKTWSKWVCECGASFFDDNGVIGKRMGEPSSGSKSGGKPTGKPRSKTGTPRSSKGGFV